ncbi:MAG: hypothetical protein L0154_01335 [Chloroflexi bacterium]|nr:hypothetical protein [Chloroflexota bacterium]
MEHTTSPEMRVKYGIPDRADQENVKAEIQSFSLVGGPADVTAYHDFHSLQIAFKHVWAELFDEGLKELGKQLFEELVFSDLPFQLPPKLSDYPNDLQGFAQAFEAWVIALASEFGLDTITTVEDYKRFKDSSRIGLIRTAQADERLTEVQKYLLPHITVSQWAVLDPTVRETLYFLTIDIKKVTTELQSLVIKIIDASKEVSELTEFQRKLGLFKEQVERLKNLLITQGQILSRLADISSRNKVQAQNIFEAAITESNKKSRIENMLEDIEARLREKYTFDVFAADPAKGIYSINFGILVTYRQEWKPLNYQVGELVSTLPLAPKESRKYSVRRVAKKNRALVELEYALQVRKQDSEDTFRVKAEIVRKATNSTNFKHNAEGGVNFAVWNAKAGHSLEVDSVIESADTKENFRQAVLKAAEEYKDEHKLEITTSSGEEFEETSSGEISNPNDEIPVTYLLYELQRRYEIREQLHKVTPVILVANEVPGPHEIDEDWLLAHDWILRRVILDKSFLPALDYLSQSFVGDELSIDVLRNNWETQLEVVAKVSRNLASQENVLDAVTLTMDKAIDKYAESLTETGGGLFGFLGNLLTFGAAGALAGAAAGEMAASPDEKETLRVRKEAAEEAFQRAERQAQELQSVLQREVNALEVAANRYAKAIQGQFNRRTQILRLRAHVKDNILYYALCEIKKQRQHPIEKTEHQC